MRPRGTGSITPHKDKYRARLPVEGRTESLGLWDTHELAEAALNRALRLRAGVPGASATVLTFATWGRRVLDIREEEGVRGIKIERRRFRLHLETCAFATKAVADVTNEDIANLATRISNKVAADKRGRRRVTKRTVQRCLGVARAIFALAIQRGMRTTNPCLGVVVKVPKDTNTNESGETVWDWLRGDEQRAILACDKIPLWLRTMIRVAWGTGWRQGEQWNFELRDVHVPRSKGCSCGDEKCIKLRERGPHAFVRWGSKGLPPKNGLTRTTLLFGEGLAGVQAWLDILPSYCPKNPLRLLFPTQTGCRRQPGPPQRSGPKVNDKWTKVYLLPEALAEAGIKRNIRWHDLRHTCGSSLVSGTWGRAWALVKVRDMLGHSSVAVTEKYAHLGQDSLRGEANETPGHGDTPRGTNGPGGDSTMAAITNDINAEPTVGLEPTTCALRKPDTPENLQGLTHQSVTSVARAQDETPQVRFRIG